MADYISILDKAVSALADNSPANRINIYDKARAAIERKLRAMDPVPPENAIARQMEQLESAIAQVELDYTAAPHEEQVEEISVEAESAAEPIDLVDGQGAVSNVVEAPTDIPDGFIDEPILIDGIGEKTAQSLAKEGVTKISQIAAMSDDQLAKVAEAIGNPGFEVTQEWKQQSLEMLRGEMPRGKTNQDRLAKFEEQRDAALQRGGDISQEPVSTIVTDQIEEPPVVNVEPTVAIQPSAPAEMAEEPKVQAPAAEEHDEDYDAFLKAFSNAGPAKTPTVDAVNVEGEVQGEPVVPAVQEPVLPSQASTLGVAPRFDPEPMTPEVAVTPIDRDMSKPVAPTAGINRPVAPVAPAAEHAQAGRPVSPAFVSELDNDFAPNRERASQRPHPALKQKKGTGGKIMSGSLLILLLGGAAAGAYYYRAPIMDLSQKGITAARELLNVGQTTEQAVNKEAEPEPENTQKDSARLGSGETALEPAAVPVQTIQPKPEAPEQPVEAEQPAVRSVDPEPATVEVQEETTNEETSTETTDAQSGTESATENTTENASTTEQATSSETAVLSGEKSYLYEEALGNTGASRDEGNISWSLVDEPPEDGAAPEPVIKGVLEIPSRGLTMNVSIKRNVDASLSASHLIELSFSPLAEFSGGNIDNISRFVMKANEQARGESLVGIPVRIDVGFFWIALNNLDQAQKTNLNLLENGDWVDVPVTYVTGRRALLTFEKGASGREVFAKALADWKNR